MRNIVEIIEEVIIAAGKAEDLKVLSKEIKKIDSEYKKVDNTKLMALIHTTLSVDGRFIYINELWDIKSRYSIIDLGKIKDEYIKNISDSEISYLDSLETELEKDEDISSLEGPDKDFEDSDDIGLGKTSIINEEKI